MNPFVDTILPKSTAFIALLQRAFSSTVVHRAVSYGFAATTLATALCTTQAFAIPSTITLSGVPTSVAKYGKFEATIPAFTTNAINLYWPYETQAPAGDVTGLAVGTGITVNAQFLPPGQNNWNNAKVQPCFWYQPMRKAATVNSNLLPTPDGTAGWKVRFAPDQTGSWKVRIVVTDKDGTRQSAISTFSCTPSSSHGYVRVSPSDSRYFEYADGTPFLPGAGIHESDSNKFDQLSGSFKLNRVWWQASDGGSFSPFGIGGQGGEKDWGGGQFTGAPAVIPPANHLLVKALNAGEVTQVNVAPGAPGKIYQWKALVKTVGVTGPRSLTGKLGINFGPALFCTDNAAGVDLPINTQWLTGSKDWTWISGTFVNGFSSGEFRWMKMGIPNAVSGTCYIAEASVREVLPGGGLGPELMSHPLPSSLQSYNQEDSFNCDEQLDAAAANDIYLKVVCFENKDVATSSIQADGTIGSVNDNNTYGSVDANTVNMQRWYQRAAMRYFAARWGWSPNVHSVEFLNEGDPFNGNHYNGANAFANYVHSVNVRPLMATTSFWHSMPSFWNNTSCDYIDVHKYVGPQSGNNLQSGYGMWNTAPTIAEPGHGNVLKMTSDTVGFGTPFYLAPLPISAGHSYRVRYQIKGQGLTKTDPSSGATSPFGAGPGVSVRVYSGHTNAPMLQCWSPGSLSSGGVETGSFDWQDRVTPTFQVTSSGAKYLTVDAETHWTYGTALFDNITVEDVTDPNNIVAVPVPNGNFDECCGEDGFKGDTALQSVDAWQQYVGGGGSQSLPRVYNKPLVWGEYGISGDAIYGSSYYGFAYSGEDQRILEDGSGVWLHKLVWAGLAPGGVTPILWWSNAVYANELFDSGKAFQAFMAGIPLTNGRYVDAKAECTSGLRAWGQKDLTASTAHLWIDNPNNNWIQSANYDEVYVKSGVVKVKGFAPTASYKIEWWDTRMGKIKTTQTIQSNASGDIQLNVNELETDVAVKIKPGSN